MLSYSILEDDIEKILELLFLLVSVPSLFEAFKS